MPAAFPPGAPNETPVQRALREARAGKVDAAIATLRFRIQRQPNDLDARQALALLLLQSGQTQAALHQLERSVAAAPRAVGYRNNLANALMTLERFGDAAEQCRQALAIDPRYERAWLGLAIALTHSGHALEAIAVCEQAAQMRPAWPELIGAHASALEAADQLDEALALMRNATQSNPSNPILMGRYLPMLNNRDLPALEIAAAHRAYASCVPPPPAPPDCDKNPQRRLRVGVLSADLRSHSVGYFAAALLRHPAPDVEWIAFNSNPPNAEDAMETAFRSHFKEWIEAAILDDAALDRAIREARIDVLIELSGHTAGSRLTALNRKPAPVIITAIGYPNTTGHPAVDWRLVDAITDPPGSEAHCTEQLLRLDRCFLCYAPPPNAPEPTMPDAAAPFTFGSFNLSNKISTQTIALWAQAMQAVPHAQLLIKSKPLNNNTARANFLARLEAGGIARERVEIISYTTSVAAHLALYQRIHVALDTTPYNGTTTTCEALWMGVPVITLAGDRHVSRVGMSLLTAAGLPQWIATNKDEFAALAKAMADDPAQLASWRRGLRAQLQSSSLLDSADYAASFHRAIRQAWVVFCERAAS
jgi:protein O-GlcNAc transferase